MVTLKDIQAGDIIKVRCGKHYYYPGGDQDFVREFHYHITGKESYSNDLKHLDSGSGWDIVAVFRRDRGLRFLRNLPNSSLMEVLHHPIKYGFKPVTQSDAFIDLCMYTNN